jgi:hypothetical protein
MHGVGFKLLLGTRYGGFLFALQGPLLAESGPQDSLKLTNMDVRFTPESGR